MKLKFSYINWNKSISTVSRNTTLKGSGNCVFVNCLGGPVVYTSQCKDERRPFCGKYFKLNVNLSFQKVRGFIVPYLRPIFLFTFLGRKTNLFLLHEL